MSVVRRGTEQHGSMVFSHFKSCMELINNYIAEKKRKKNTEVCQSPTVWEWGMGTLLNSRC